MLSSLAQNQMQLQENNTVMMTDLLSSHHNLYVLADVEVYDGRTARLQDWLLQVEKASELTKIELYEIAFTKSHGSPHKITKNMGPGKSWSAVKERLEESYSLFELHLNFEWCYGLLLPCLNHYLGVLWPMFCRNFEMSYEYSVVGSLVGLRDIRFSGVG